MKSFKKISISFLFCSTCVSLVAQQSQVWTVQDLFDQAEQQSLSLQVSQTQLEAADAALAAARSARLPEMSVSLSASYMGPGRLWDRDFSNSTRVDMEGVKIGERMQGIMDHGSVNGNFGNSFAFEATQVLYAGGAISSGIALADLGKKMAVLDVEKSRQEVRFLLVGHYLDLYKLSNQVEVLDQNIALTDTLLSNMRARLDQGTVLPTDITRFELLLESLKLARTKVEDGRKILNHQIVSTLHLPEGTVIMPDTTLLDSELKAMNEADWQSLASAHNLGLQQARLASDMSAHQLQITKSASLPSLALVFQDHLDGPITIEVPVLNHNFNYWFVGLGLKYELSSIYKNRSELRRSKLEVRRATEAVALASEGIENAVQASYTNFLTSVSEIRTNQKSCDLANENYRTTHHRYDNGLALLTDMLDASSMKLSADMDLCNARINLIYNYFKLKYVSHTL